MKGENSELLVQFTLLPRELWAAGPERSRRVRIIKRWAKSKRCLSTKILY